MMATTLLAHYPTEYSSFDEAWADFETYTKLEKEAAAAAKRARSEDRWTELNEWRKHWRSWADFANFEACALLLRR